MNRKLSVMKSIVVAAALVAGVSGIARADDNSMNPYTGDSYAFFNGGNLPQSVSPVIDKAPSAFHRENPHGLPFSTYEALSTTGPEYKPAPVIDRTASTFHQEFPHGLPFITYETLASTAPMFHQPNQSPTGAVATTNAPVLLSRAAN